MKKLLIVFLLIFSLPCFAYNSSVMVVSTAAMVAATAANFNNTYYSTYHQQQQWLLKQYKICVQNKGGNACKTKYKDCKGK